MKGLPEQSLKPVISETKTSLLLRHDYRTNTGLPTVNSFH